MNSIRNAKAEDAQIIRDLLEQLGYPHTVDFVRDKILQLSANDMYRIFVYELEGRVVAFMTMHFTIQIGYEGDFATIDFFAVDSTVRSKGIGKVMEEYCVQLSKEHNCSIIEVYSGAQRADAHRFYERQGYKVYEKYFMKELN